MRYRTITVKCYILGAGASFGQNTQKPKTLRPPKSDEFFVKGCEYGILKKEIFPKLHKNVQRRSHDKGSLYFDIESFLGDLERRSQKNEESSQALGESYFYIYELLRYCSAFYSPLLERDNYYKLSEYILREGSSVLSLNYDILLEKAIQSRGGTVAYSTYTQKENIVPLCKVHGSINWLNIIPPSGGEFSKFNEFTRQIHNISFTRNIALGEPTGMRILPFDELNNTYCIDLVEDSLEAYEPVIIPPVAEGKNYRKVLEYDDIWNNAGKMLSHADEIVIIGSSIRREDDKLRKTIKQSVKSSTKVTLAVGRNPEKVMKSLDELIDNPEYDCHTYFDDYINSRQ